jgi:hypothetical protein
VGVSVFGIAFPVTLVALGLEEVVVVVIDLSLSQAARARIAKSEVAMRARNMDASEERVLEFVEAAVLLGDLARVEIAAAAEKGCFERRSDLRALGLRIAFRLATRRI